MRTSELFVTNIFRFLENSARLLRRR